MVDEQNQGKRIEKNEDFIGKVVDGYKIVQRIGESLVYLAFKESTEEQVAIKLFYPDPYACNHGEILERMHSIMQLDHDNIVKVYKTGEEEKFIYAVMEYVPGENLYDLMKRNPRLHWAAAAELAREIIKGLVAAHNKGVTHRTLHPDRVLLGKGGQIKINFCNEGEITPSSELAHYVSPELFLGQTLEAYSDVYSLGAIIYNIVTGKPPLAGKNPKEIALKHREMEPVVPKYGVADIPHMLSLLLTRSLSKNLKERYNYSYELQAAINNFLINNIGMYQIGSYKKLLPKVVEVSKSGKAFDEAIDGGRSKHKKDKQDYKEEKKETEFEYPELAQKVSNYYKVSKELVLQMLPMHWKILIACVISFLVNSILMFMLT